MLSCADKSILFFKLIIKCIKFQPNQTLLKNFLVIQGEGIREFADNADEVRERRCLANADLVWQMGEGMSEGTERQY